MILRRYGDTLQSVDTNFDSRALTEIGFRRNGDRSEEAEAFFAAHRKVEEHELAVTAEGRVQDEAETELLDRLEARLREVEEGLGEGEVLVIENTADDYPKTREKRRDVVEEGTNRLEFHWRVEPPLRVGVYRRDAG